MTGIFQDLEMVFQGMRSWISFLPRITFSNVTEIIILTILVYYALLWIKSTKAWYLLRGIAMITGTRSSGSLEEPAVSR